MTNPNFEEYEFEEAIRRSEALREAIRQAREQRQQAALAGPADGDQLPARVVEGEVVRPAGKAVAAAIGTDVGSLVAECFNQLAGLAASVRWKKIPPQVGEQMRRLVHEQVSGVIAVMQVQHEAIARALALQLDLELADLIFEKLTDPATNVLQQERLLAEFERHRREALGIVGRQLPPPTVL